MCAAKSNTQGVVSPTVSIVIPTYNVEKYLEQCVESVRCQTLDDIEIIIVDDGSTDASGTIADRLALYDSRIRVIHQENAGLGPARNTGINAAHGPYIGFVDSDDWIEPEMFESLWKASVKKHADISAMGFKIVSNGQVVETKLQALAGTEINDTAQIDRYRLSFYGPESDSINEQPLVSACVRLYSRQLLSDYNLRFKAIRSEDVDFNIRAMRCAACITFIDDAMYCYRKDNQPSITNGINPRMINQYERFVEALGECLIEEAPEIRNECRKRLQRGVFGYMRTLINVCSLSGIKGSNLVEFTDLVLESPVLSPYLIGYPYSGMSIAQRLLLYFMRKRNAMAIAFLFQLRNSAIG